jgi:hypothetical protein
MRFMKRLLTFAIVLSSLSIPAFAAKNSQTINLPDPVTVGSTKLPAGDYKISWTGSAPDVQVTLEQKGVQKPVTVTLPGKLVPAKNDRTELTTNTQAGSVTLESVQLKDSTLSFTSTPASGQ